MALPYCPTCDAPHLPCQLTPEQAYGEMLSDIQALMAGIRQAPTTNRPGLSFAVLYGLFVFTIDIFAQEQHPTTPHALAALLVDVVVE